MIPAQPNFFGHILLEESTPCSALATKGTGSFYKIHQEGREAVARASSMA